MTPEKTVVITGANGFLGSQLVSSLQQKGKKIIPVSRKNGLNAESLKSIEHLIGFDTLIHLAAQTFVPASYTDTASFFHNNIISTLNCLEICKKNNAKMIFASSYVYGKPQYLPIDENHPTDSWNPYATSKLVCEKLCSCYYHEFGVPVVMLRFFNIYGTGQRNDFLIPKIIDGLNKGLLELESDYPKRDFVHISDAINAIIKVINNQPNSLSIYNIGSGKSHSVKEIVEICSGIIGKPATIIYRNEKRKNEILDVVADISKIKSELNWHPILSFQEGIKKTIELSL